MDTRIDLNNVLHKVAEYQQLDKTAISMGGFSSKDFVKLLERVKAANPKLAGKLLNMRNSALGMMGKGKPTTQLPQQGEFALNRILKNFKR